MKSIILTLLALSTLAQAQDIFILKKSRNKLNVLHFSAKVEKNCAFPKSGAVRAYWIMGEDGGGELDLDSKEKSYFQPKVTYNNGSEIRFTFGALNEMSENIPRKEVEIHIENCRPVAYIEFDNQQIKLKEIYANVNMLMIPYDFAIKGKTLSGSNFVKTID